MRQIQNFSLLLVISFSLLTCRPSVNDGTTQDVSGSDSDSTMMSQDPASDDGASDSTGNRKPMIGEVGSSGDFMITAAEAGLTEVKLSELALERSKSPKVKKFAQMMLKEHNDSNAELMKIAKDANVTLPAQLCMECEAKYNALAKNDNAAFDSVYTQLMIKDHKALLEKFVFQTTSGSNGNIKKWASEKVPVLQRSLNAAMALDDSVTVRKGSR